MQCNCVFLLPMTKEGLKKPTIGLEHATRVTLCRKYTKSRVDRVNSFIMSLVNSTKKLTEAFYINVGVKTFLKRNRSTVHVTVIITLPYYYLTLPTYYLITFNYLKFKSQNFLTVPPCLTLKQRRANSPKNL